MQQTLCDGLVVGTPYEDLHDRAHHELAGIIGDLGIIDCAAEEMVASGATRKLFPHGLGHSLGIQVHDVGCKPHSPRAENAFLRTTATVEAGHVFTIEPGCYFIPSLLAELRSTSVAKHVSWSLVEELRDFGGIRIEDNIAVTDSGTVNLTRDNWAASP